MIYGMRFEVEIKIKDEQVLEQNLSECPDGVDYQTRTDFGKVSVNGTLIDYFHHVLPFILYSRS